jgi:GTP cyclohydrolase IA
MLYRITVHPDRDAMAAALAALLKAAGLPPSGHPDLEQTPLRVAKLWAEEFLAGYAMDAAKILGDPVVGEAAPDLVVVAGLEFHAMCPHHLLPFRGLAHLAYLPAGKLAGFGRLADLVACFTRRLTLQERATHQIAEALWQGLGARGAGCVLEAEQLCLALPGEGHPDSFVVTSAFVGEMADRPELKARLLAASRGARRRG